MNRRLRAGQIAALCSSVALAGGYVAFRSTSQSAPVSEDSERIAAPSVSDIIHSSKRGEVAVPLILQFPPAPESETLDSAMTSSKSGIVFTPKDAAPPDPPPPNPILEPKPTSTPKSSTPAEPSKPDHKKPRR